MNKQRGQRHYANKKKYNKKFKQASNSNVASCHYKSRALNNTTLTCNWNRFEQPLDDGENDSTNFSLLSKAPTSYGDHFQFKNDKKLVKEYEFCDLQNNKAFTLDLNALQHTLSVIPFHERCDLDEAYLTKDDLQTFINKSLHNRKQYESHLNICLNLADDISRISVCKEEATNNISQVCTQTNQNTAISERQDKEESLCFLEESTFAKKEQLGASDKDELEHWLDEFLTD